MSPNLATAVRDICQSCSNDPARMMDVVLEVQKRFHCVSSEAMNLIAERLGVHRVDVQSVVSFYSFLSEAPKGDIIIRICDDIIDRMAGSAKVERAFSDALGIRPGQTSPDGRFTLERTACIGMSDQAPAALINDVVFTELSGEKAHEIVSKLTSGYTPHELVRRHGDGNNGHPLVHAMVVNNLHRKGPVIFDELPAGSALEKALALSPAEVIRDIKTARLRGRGGAGFPTGMKWEFTRAAEGEKKYIICNADEGEPGTFKDRVMLTESPDLLIEGMTIAAYAIGSDSGILYLRAEYAYLRKFLEQVLTERRERNLLGRDIRGKQGFHFDIRIQMGAGAYVCGEETALISSCEGLRGDPKNRPPFPAQKGYLGYPTVVNNVETFCCVPRILQNGPGWFAQIGTNGSAGTKLLSISGDCTRPGVYEIPFGMTLQQVLEMCGGEDAMAVQVGGPSGCMVGSDHFHRKICYDDLATGGSIMIFNAQRNLLEVVDAFLHFFMEEGCGHCTPCRVGNMLLQERIRKIRNGFGEPEDLDYLDDLGRTVQTMSRCGLGQTSPNPVLSTLANFRSVYELLLRKNANGLQPAFSLQDALKDAEAIAGRASAHIEQQPA